MSTTETALTAHLVIPGEQHDDAFLARICSAMHNKYGIEPSTIQKEKNAQGASCDPESV